jgi:hypothetical protein
MGVGEQRAKALPAQTRASHQMLSTAKGDAQFPEPKKEDAASRHEIGTLLIIDARVYKTFSVTLRSSRSLH